MNETNIVLPDSEEVQDNTSEVGVNQSSLDYQDIADTLIEDNEDLEKKTKQERVKKNIYKIGFIIAIIIIIILLLRGCSGNEKEVPRILPELETAGLIERQAEEVKKAPRIDIPVIQSFTVSKNQPYVDLYNPETNKGNYYLQFAFTVVGEETPFYESKFVEGGHRFSVNIGELLEIGEYDTYVTVRSFEENSLEEKSGDKHIITVGITE